MPPPSASEPSILAFDGGSTKTDAVLVTSGGDVLGRARVGPSNHQLVGLEGTMKALTEAVAAVRHDAGLDDADKDDADRDGADRDGADRDGADRDGAGQGAGFALCQTGVYCLAGLDLPVDEDKLAPVIDATGWTERAILRNDTFAVTRAGTTGTWGIGVVCGTGMNCAASGPDGRTVRFPALAELSGDFAPGGAWLGLRALGLALRARDGRGAPTALSDLVPSHFGEADPEAVLTGIYTGAISYARLFELARVLLDAAAAGDEPARQAADTLADEIVAFVRAAVTRLGVGDETVEVVLGGGIFETADAVFHARVTAGVRAAAPEAALVRLDVPPVVGAALLGLDAIGAPAPAQFTLREALTSTPPQPT